MTQKPVKVESLKDLNQFDQVIFVPHHLNTPEQIADLNNWKYGTGQIAQGFVTSTNARGAFVRFWRVRQDGGILPPEIQNKMNSEHCDLHNLYFFETFAPNVIHETYEEIMRLMKGE